MENGKKTPPLVSGAKPLVGHLFEFQKDRHALLERGYREHGEVFAIKLATQPIAVVIGPEHHRTFFTETDEKLNISTPYTFLKAAFGEVLFIASHETYKRQRPLLLQAFGRKKMLRYVEVMQIEVQRWLDGLGDEGEMELTAEIGRLVQQVAGHALMGEAFQEEVGREFWEQYLLLGKALDPVLPPDWPLPKFIRRDRARARLREIMAPIIAERRRNPEQYDDFLQDFVNYRYPDGSEVEDEVLLNLILGLMFAGHETTAGQAGWMIIQLLQNSGYLALVQEEVDEHLPPGTPMSPKVLKQLPHLGWAAQETERRRPSADILFRDVDEPVEMGDYVIPAGWRVQVATEVAHTLPDLWSDPDEYDPCRFAPGREEHKQDRFSLIGFGGGTHKCMGMNFANNEMTVIAALLFQQFDLELLTPEPGIERGLGANRPEETWVRYRRKR